VSRDTGELVELTREMTGEEALRRGLIPVPPEMVELLEAMTDEERLAWAKEQTVRTELPGGIVRAQPVGSLLERGLRLRKERNERKRARRERRGK
jgi:hypothetical protein